MKKIIYVALFLLAAGNTVTMQAQQESVVLTTSTPITILPPESIKDVALIRADGTNGAISYYKTGSGAHLTYLTTTQAQDMLLPNVVDHVSDFCINDYGIVYVCGALNNGNGAYIARFHASQLQSDPTVQIHYFVIPEIDDLLRIVTLGNDHVMAISHNHIVEITSFFGAGTNQFYTFSSELFNDIVVTEHFVAIVGWKIGLDALTLRRGIRNASSVISTMNDQFYYNFSGAAYVEPASYSHAVSMDADKIAVTHMAGRTNSGMMEVQTRIHYFELNAMAMYNSQAIQEPTKCEATEMAYVPADNSVAMQKTVFNDSIYSSSITYFDPDSTTNHDSYLLYSPDVILNSVDTYDGRSIITCMNDTNSLRWLKKDKTRDYAQGLSCYTRDTVKVLSIPNVGVSTCTTSNGQGRVGSLNPISLQTTQDTIIVPCSYR